MPYQQIIFLIAVLFHKNVLCDTNYRLNSNVTVSSYSLHLTPYFDTGDNNAFTFNGEVNIVIQTNETGIDQIKLHSEDLIFSAENITLSSETTVIGLNPQNPVYFDKNYTFVYINLEVPLQANVPYSLTISYQGPMRADLSGFYRSYYLQNGVKKWLGASQMEPTHARKVFPCFDEPQYKAVFLLTIDRPENYSQSLANTKLQTSIKLTNGYVREVFYPTPVMSTYLLAFLVSEFVAADYVANGPEEFGVYTRPEAANQTTYASDFGQRVEKALSTFYGISYYSTDSNLKLDHVALPDFRAGAMENWGLIKYREALMLYVPEESTPYYKYRVAQIVAHETTHMWFGNLVTCHWWSNTWLNEGFANYFQDYITAQIEPEVGSSEMLVTSSLYTAYAADEVPTAAPITNNEVNSPSEISGHFGTMSYQKAGSVIRMMHHLIGDAAFKFGLNAYLEANKFSVGYPNLMYAALDKGVQNENSLASYAGANIADVMSSWIAQAGHPILQVDVDYDDLEISLKQKRFYLDSSHESDETYAIPVTYTTENKSDFDNTKPAFIMNDKNMKLNVSNSLKEEEWVIFNIQETGFYRVNYDEHTWILIGNALKGNQRSTIHTLNRAKIINDLFAFVTADEEDFDLLYSVLEFLKQETEFSVWFSAISGLNTLRNRYYGTDIIHLIDQYSLLLMDNVIDRLGYSVNDTDSFVTLRNRMQILEYACKIGHQGCIDNALKLFKGFKEDGVKISPSLRPVAYCNGLRYGTEEDYIFLWEEMSKTNVANEVIVIQNALGCTTINEKLQEYLSSIIGEEATVRGQDVTNPVTSVLGYHENADLVFDFFKSNYTALANTYPSIQTVITYIAAALHTEEQFDEFEAWLSSCGECSEEVKLAGLTTLEAAKDSTRWAESHREKISKTLRSYGTRAQHSALSLVLVSAAALIICL